MSGDSPRNLESRPACFVTVAKAALEILGLPREQTLFYVSFERPGGELGAPRLLHAQIVRGAHPNAK